MGLWLWTWSRRSKVSAVGEGVEGFKVGDKVSIEPAVPAANVKTAEKEIIISVRISGCLQFREKETE